MFSLQFSRLYRVVMLLVIFHIQLKDVGRPQLNVSSENGVILFPCFTVFMSLHESVWPAKILADFEINNLAAARPPPFCYTS
jgi:hypothetical protein